VSDDQDVAIFYVGLTLPSPELAFPISAFQDVTLSGELVAGSGSDFTTTTPAEGRTDFTFRSQNGVQPASESPGPAFDAVVPGAVGALLVQGSVATVAGPATFAAARTGPPLPSTELDVALPEPPVALPASPAEDGELSVGTELSSRRPPASRCWSYGRPPRLPRAARCTS
jgi:hypothetical protein